MKPARIATWIGAATLTVTCGYQGLLLARQREALATEQRRSAQVQAECVARRAQLEQAGRDLAQAEQSLLAEETPDAGDGRKIRAELSTWRGRVAQLRQMFDEQPGHRIPELQFLSELDWFSLAHRLALESESDRRHALAMVRDEAVKNFLPMLKRALRAYVASNNDVLPLDIYQLQPFFNPPIDSAILARYEMSGRGNVTKHQVNGVDTIAERAPVDEDYDWRHTVRTDGQYWGPWDHVVRRNIVMTARKEFKAANGGAVAKDDSELLPYIADPTWRNLVAASAQYEKDHLGQRSITSADLRPYVQDPAARATLEKMIRQEKNSPDWYSGTR